MVFLKNTIKKYYPNFFFILKNIYYFFFNWGFLILFYNKKKDLDYNESLLKHYYSDINEVKFLLKSNNLNYHNDQISWHYHLFAFLKYNFEKKKNIKILEIGTFLGEFTLFLSKIFLDSKITTIDLEDKENEYISNPNKTEKIKKRNANLNKKNINPLKFNSIYLHEKIKDELFDLIWIDGDHLNPQVTLDIFSCLKILKTDGFICVDDICIDKIPNSKRVSNESYKTLQYLEKLEILCNNYLLKRIRARNLVERKYISISKLKQRLY
jgi:predicted O-methyltransferase YrrM